VGFLVSFGAIASGPPSSAVMLTFYGAVIWFRGQHCLLSVKARQSWLV
jgi:hypothetical protein